MKQRYWAAARLLQDALRWPVAKRAESRFERDGKTGVDRGSERVLQEVIEWLCRAQDNSASADGGVARDYDLIAGWATSYPETTGYIVPTLVQYSHRTGRSDLRGRAKRMLDWLVGIQLSDGAFMGGKIDAQPVLPVTFNTGQILLGLASGEREFGDYLSPLRRAGDWLVATQDADGCWRRFPSPFAREGEKSYETHVAWGLVEAARIDPHRGYGEAAVANARWAASHVAPNGWIDHCCLDDAAQPLTHTIGYALRGFLEVYRYSHEAALLDVARRIADGVLTALGRDGHLPGQLDRDWSPAVKWACLTGSAQIAHCWLMLFEETGESKYADAAFRANAYVRRTVRIDGAAAVRGGVKGSWPFDGTYGRYKYLNWAAKFLADSLMLEMDVRSRLARGHTAP